MLGGINGRFDHSLYNIHLCKSKIYTNNKIFLIDKNNIIFVICGEYLVIMPLKHHTVGIFPIETCHV